MLYDVLYVLLCVLYVLSCALCVLLSGFEGVCVWLLLFFCGDVFFLDERVGQCGLNPVFALVGDYFHDDDDDDVDDDDDDDDDDDTLNDTTQLS